MAEMSWSGRRKIVAVIGAIALSWAAVAGIAGAGFVIVQRASR